MNSIIYKYNLLEKLKTDKETYGKGILVETGCGTPLYSLMCRKPNTASKLIIYAHSPTDFNYMKIKYEIPESIRAVSRQTCQHIIDLEIKLNPHAEWIFCNSIQIGNDIKTQTHGWISFYINNITRYYHFSIDNYYSQYTRTELINKIELICLDIFLSKNDISYKFTNGYIDIIWKGFNKYTEFEDRMILCNSIINTGCEDDQYCIFSHFENGAYYNERFNDYFRQYTQNKEIVIFKGSFDPLQDMHLKMVEEITKDGTKTVIFMISISNREKNKTISSESLFKRINVINEMGYTVIVNRLGMFHNAIIHFKNHQDFNSKLSFLVGFDTISRLSDDNKEEFGSIYNDIIFYVINRGIFDINNFKDVKLFCAGLKTRYLDLNINPISSTLIRKTIEDKKYTDLDNLYENYKLLNIVKKYYL